MTRLWRGNRLEFTPTALNVTKYYCRKCKNWSKSDYIIDTGPIHVRNCWPGSVTVVTWHGWSRDWCARGLGFDSGGTSPFGGVSFK